MRVRLVSLVVVAGVIYHAGDVVTMRREIAQTLIRHGLAVPVPESPQRRSA